MRLLGRLTCTLALGAALAACAGYAVRDGAIVDARDSSVPLRGVNWFGAETKDHLVNGLWARNYRELIAEVKSKGINAVRLPICSETLHGAPIAAPSLNLAENPELAGLDAMQLFDRIVAELDRQGLYVLLDLHTADCATITPLWTSADYPESAWLADLQSLASRYRGVRRVIGIDLKNEPHDEATWGTGLAATDWNKAAERAARAVLAIAPDWLIFVEGVQNNPSCSSQDPHVWGGNLEPLACTALDIPPDRLVLSPHSYGPDVAASMPAFAASDYPRNLPAIWERDFGRYRQQGYAVVLGEFGGKYGEGDPRDRAWQDALVAYLNTKGIRSGFYWSLNPNSHDTGGLLRDDWRTWREDKLALLQRFWSGTAAAAVPGPLLPPLPQAAPASAVSPPSATPANPSSNSTTPTSGDAPTPAPAPVSATPAVQGPPAGANGGGMAAAATLNDPALVATRSVDSDWGAGYCLRYQLRNTGSAPVEWRFEQPLDGTIRNLWSARWQVSNGRLQASGEDWNRTLKPGETADFGWCAVRGS